jgi:hypothetical protein
MRFIEIPALITEDIEDPSIVDITEEISVSISGTTMTIDGGSKVSGEVTITLTGDVNINAVSTSNLRQPSIHKITIKTNGTGNFTYVPNAGVTASSVSTTTKTGSDLEILLITTSGGDTYLDLDVADYVSPAANFSNVVTGFKVSELTSTYGATAKLYKPDGTLLTTVNSETMGSGVNFGYTESPGDVIYKLEVTDDLGRKSTYNLPRKWINYAMGTTSTPGFQKFRLEGIDYTTTMTLPSLGSSSTAKVYRTSDHGYMGIKFKIQGRNAPSDDWVDIANADENDDVLAFGDYLYHRVWVKPTAKATTTVSSSNVVTLTLSNLTEENVTTSFTGADPFEIDETSNVFVFEETAKIGTVPFTVTLGTETYTNAVTATTEEVSTVPNTDMTAAGPNKLHDIQLSQTGGYMSEASGNGKYIAYNKTNDSVVYILKGDPVSGYTDYTTITYSQVTNAYLVGSMTYDGKYIIIARRGSNSYHYEIWKHDESAETYTKLSQTVQTIDTSTYVHKPAFVPAEGNYNFAISGHNSSSGQDFSVQLYKHTVGTDTWTAQTIISNPRPSSVQGTTSNRSMQAKSFTKDGKYLMFGNTSTYGGYDVFNVDFDENTVTHAGNWVNNGDIGHSGSITSDGKYILLFDDDSNSRKIFKNNDAGDWSSSTDVTSDFTFEDTDNDQGYGICFFGENSEYFVSTGASGGAVRVYRWYPKKEVTLTFSNPTLTLTGQNVTISSAKLYRDDVLFHTYGTESNVVLRSDQTGTYQAIVNDVYYSNRVTPDFTTTRSVSAPQLEFDGYNKLTLANYITTTSDFPSIITFDVSAWSGAPTTIWYVLDTTKSTDTSKFYETNAPTTGDAGNDGTATGIEFRCESDGTTKVYANTDDNTGQPSTLNVNSTSYPSNYVDGVTVTSGDVLYGVEGSFTRFGFTVTSSMLFTRTVITPTSTTLGLPDGTTRDLTTQSNVYIYETGTYTANVQTSDTFAYLSNVVTSQPSQNSADVGPTFTFDGYNRLNLSNLTQTSSSLRFGSNTYDTNTASNVYVTDAGEYKLEARDANTFVMSNVYVGAVSQHPTDVVPTLTFDGYNKLTIDNVDTIETATIKKDGAAFATTTSDTVYIRDTGTYTAEVKGTRYGVSVNSTAPSVVNHINSWISDTGDYSTSGYRGTLRNPSHDTSNKTYSYYYYWEYNSNNDSYDFRRDNVLVYNYGDRKWYDGRNDYDPVYVMNGDATTYSGTYPTSSDANEQTISLWSGSNRLGVFNNPYYDASWVPPIYGVYAIELSKEVTGTISQHPTDVVPSLTYDNYNKITLNQLNYEDTATVSDPNGSTYNIGTAKTMYVKDTGEYVFKISGTDKYVDSNVYVSSVDLAGAPTKPIDFDGYNKLTLIDAGSNVSANVTYFSNTYELGSANVLYINGAGTYDLEMSGSNVFALSNTVVNALSTPVVSGTHRFPLDSGTLTDLNDNSVSFDSGATFEAGTLRNDSKTSYKLTVGQNKNVTLPSALSNWCVSMWVFIPYVTSYGSSNSNDIPSDFSSYTHNFGYSWSYPWIWHMANGREFRHRTVHDSHIYEYSSASATSSESTNMYHSWGSSIGSSSKQKWHPGNNNNNAFMPEAWHHMAWEYNGTTGVMKWYCDGIERTTAEVTMSTGCSLNGMTFGDNTPNGILSTDGGTSSGNPYWYISDLVIAPSWNIDTYNLTKGTYKHFLPIPQTLGVLQLRGEGNEESLSSPSLTFDGYNKLTLENFTAVNKQWPPADGTRSSPTWSDSDKVADWTITGASYGNGSYKGTSSVAVWSDSSNHAGPYWAFNNDDSTADDECWHPQSIVVAILTIEMPSSMVLGSYELYYRNYTDYTCGPKDWTVEGSNDGSTWTVLDTRTNQPQVSAALAKIGTYTVSNSTSYSKYRLNVTANHGGDQTIIGEWKLFEKNTRTAKLMDPNDDTYSLGQTQNDIYIEETGEYILEVTNSDQSAVVKTTIGAGQITTNPLENYRSVIIPSAYLDYGSSSDRQVTICFWYKHTNNNGYTIRLANTNTGGDLALGIFGTFADGTNRLRGFTGKSNDSVYTYWDNLPSGFDETKWNFYIFRYIGNDNAHQMYLPEFDYYDNGSGTYGRSWRYVVFDMPSDSNFITDFSVYEGNKAVTASWRETLYNNGQIGGAANETTDRLHYLRFHKDTIGDDIGSKNSDISSGSITTSTSIPGFDGDPSLTFDGYNKLSIENLTPTSTRLTYGSNTYEIGTASNVYIEDAGTYKMATGDANTFALVSNVVGTISTPVISPFTSTQNDITITGGTENPARYYKFDTLNSNSSKLFYENYTISNDVHNINKGISFYYDANDNLVVNHNDTNGSGDPGAIENVTTSSGFLNSGVVNASPGDIIRGRPGDNTSTLRVQYTVPTFNQGTPSLTFDTYNKLSIENLTPTSTTLTDPNGSSFDIGTASNVYIRDSGTYSIASKDANTFVLASNTVTGTPTGTTYVYDSNTFTTPSQTYDTTKTITVSNVPSTLTDVPVKSIKGRRRTPFTQQRRRQTLS